MRALFAEEYLAALHSKTLELMVRQRKMDIGDLGKISEWIAEDEQRHKTAIMMIGEIASKQKQS